ncbi:MAG TPA: cytochrome c-type biogenesis protein CcmH [Anaerolineales bacterium]|nr:cytochrome c-type biogenesis protein CcmH [Anaerolineales bacterium]
MKKQFIKLAVLAFLFGAVMGITSTVSAQEPMPSDNEVNAIAKDLFCPVCENTPLDVCATQACAQWRELIRLKLSEGWSEEQIEQYFVDQYGARVLSEPPKQGLFWLVYVIPPVLIIIGVVIFVKALRNIRAIENEELALEKSSDNTDEYMSKIEEELKGLKNANR